MSKKELELSQDDFDLVWEVLLQCCLAMERGSLNAHEGLLGSGPKNDDLTQDMAKRVRKVTCAMSKHVAMDDDPVTLKLEDEQ